MADSLFKVSAKWEGSLEQDVDSHLPGIKSAANMALHSCESVLITSLSEHIQKDWFDRWYPIEYRRRTDHPEDRIPGDGEPLGSEEYMDTKVSDLTLTFLYTPKSNHRYAKWANHRWDDELIETIQLGPKGKWTWISQDDPPPERPFWNNFVEELRNGLLFAAFEDGFGGRGYDLVREGGEKDLDFPGDESMLAGGIDFGAGSLDDWVDENW